MAKGQWDVHTGSTTPTIIRNAEVSSTALGTTKTNWSRSTASGFSRNGRSITKAVMNGRIRAGRIQPGSSRTEPTSEENGRLFQRRFFVIILPPPIDPWKEGAV